MLRTRGFVFEGLDSKPPYFAQTLSSVGGWESTCYDLSWVGKGT